MSRVFSYAAYARIITGLQAGYLRLNGFARGLVEACGHHLYCLQLNLLLFLSAKLSVWDHPLCAKQSRYEISVVSYLNRIFIYKLRIPFPQRD
jgi:hypothetical protein